MHEKAREVAWRAESQGFRHRMDRRRAVAQPVDGVLQPQRIRVKARRDAGALPEQMEEMRPRQAGYLDPDIDILRIGRRRADVVDHPADAEINARRLHTLLGKL